MGQKISETKLKEEIRSVVRQNIKEVTTNDWHYKAIMSIWDKGGSFTRKKIGAVLCGDPNANRRDVEEALRDSDYSEVTDVTDRLRIEGVIEEEDSIPGGLAKGMTLNDIAEKHGVSVDVLVAEFKKGIQTEMEHTTDREMAKEITLDHLFEDPQYYTKLAKVEEYVDDKGVEHVAAALPQTEEEPIKEEDYTETPEETLEGLKEMAMGNLERIADYANMISDRMKEGQELDSWMYSQLTIALENLNSVHDAMDGVDGIKESVNEEKVYIDYLNKQKGFKQDRIKFNSYEEAVKWARKNFEKFNPDMIKYESVNEEIKVGQMVKVDNPHWEGALGKKGPFRRKVKMIDGDNVFFTDGSNSSIKYIKEEKSINELTSNEKQIKTGNPANVFYAFYKGKFAAQYWAMNSSDLFNMFWNEFKVRRPAGSQFKLNPEFIIVSKKEYDRNPNHYAKLKPYVDKFWDKLQNESVNEGTESDIIAQIKNIAKTHQNNIIVDPKSGKKMRVDAFSASAIATVYDALSDSNKEKFLQSGLLGMQAMAMKLLKR